MTDHGRVQFGPFEADLATGEVFHNGSRFLLQEKPLEILTLLLGTPGQLVSRKEILSKVWPDVYVESDLSLNTAVRRLRAVLEKADPEADLIETVGSHGYRLRAEVKVAASFASDAHSERNPIRLGVLSFKGFNGDEDDHFAEGLTAQIIVQLGHAYKKDAIVLSPLTAFLAGKSGTIPQVARRLQAEYILTGTVWRASARLRVFVQLIRTADQCSVWNESYTHQEADIFQMQDEITRDIARGLRKALPPNGSQPRMSTAPRTYEKYLKARFFSYKFVPSTFEKATNLFEQVIAEDPNFGPAPAALALMLTAAMTYGGPPQRYFHERVEQLVNHALSLSDELTEAHVAQGWLSLWRTHWKASEASFLRAIETNPSFSLNYPGYASLLCIQHRFEEAIAAGQRSCELDPLSPIMHAMLGLTYYLAGRMEEAIHCEKNALELDPCFCPAYEVLGFIHKELGRFEESVQSMRKSVEYGPAAPLSKCFLAWSLAAAGQSEEALSLLDSLLELRKTYCFSATAIASVYAELKRPDDAWMWLEAAIEEMDTWRSHLHLDPRFRPFWDDARFPSLLTRLALSTLTD